MADIHPEKIWIYESNIWGDGAEMPTGPSLVLLSDLHLGQQGRGHEEAFVRLCRWLEELRPDAVAVTGDVAHIPGDATAFAFARDHLDATGRSPGRSSCATGASPTPAIRSAATNNEADKVKREDFRAWAHELVDWMADYVEDSGRYPIQPDVEPGELRDQFPTSPPEQAEPFEQIFGDFRTQIVPGMTHWNHPGWFAYFPANHSPPSILAEMLTATLGAQCMSWSTSPVATELEEVVTGWLAQMLGLPDGFTGVIQDTASTATLVSLLTAREKATDYGWGVAGPSAARPHRIYASAHAHSSIAKAVKLAGFGLDNLVEVPCDEHFRLDPDALREAIEADTRAGYLPTAVVATVGTTSSTSVDPLPNIGAICREHDIWFHVDAAYAGSAAILPERRHILDGLEFADTFVFNPHKWLFTNFDCSAYFVRDVDALLRTFSMNPEYLKSAHDADVKNFRDWGIQLGRRFRALKLWFVIRSYGVEGLREMIRHHLELGAYVAGTVASWDDFEIIGPTDLGLTCFRWTGPAEDLDLANAAIMARANEHNDVRFTHTKLHGHYVIRFVVGQLYTEREHVDLGLRRIREAADSLAGSNHAD